MSTSKFLRHSVIAAGIAAASLSISGPAQAGLDPYIGEVMLVGFNFCPQGYAEAAGQLLSISQNTALFALLGTTYGGNGQTTFALPDLRGRSPIGQGQGPGLSSFTMGQVGGTETVTLSVNQMPAHNHVVNATSALADKPGPQAKYLANDPNAFNKYSFGPANVLMASDMVGQAGGSQPFANRSPYLAMRWCIALQGIFPSQS